MVYKKGPPYAVRAVKEICRDIDAAREHYGTGVKTLFLPAGNTIAMPTRDLAAVCQHAVATFPDLQRITVYGSAQYIAQKGRDGLITLGSSGLGRIHMGLESGDDAVLKNVKKGADAAEQIRAGQLAKAAGISLSVYVILGLGGVDLSKRHAVHTAKAINAMEPDFVRLRTLMPKINTFLLHQIRKGRFQLLSPHQVLEETRCLLENLQCRTILASDHYTNYLNLSGNLPEDKSRLLREIDRALKWPAERFRPIFVGTQ